MRLAIFVFVAAFACGSAAEVAPARGNAPVKPDAAIAELKPKLRALLLEALKANDVWTALQVESYSQRIGVRSSPILGGSEIVGDPVMAFPNRVSAFWDRGEQVSVVSGGRLYQLAADGRPLAVSVPLEGMPGACALNLDGKVFAAIERRRKPSAVMAFSVRSLPGGSELFKATMPYTSGDSLPGSACVAEDGSAALALVLDSDDAGPRLFVARANGMTTVVPGYFRPLGVGSAGKWVIAEPWATRNADARTYALLTSAGAKLFISAAMGPGIAAAISSVVPPPPPAAAPAPAPTPAAKSGAARSASTPAPAADAPAPPPEPEIRLHLVKADGELADLPLTIGLGKDARVRTVGRWLVVGSGAGAKGPAEVDLLGNVVKGSDAKQAPAILFYRWSDLAADPAAAPAFQTEGEFAVAASESATVYVWNDKAIAAVDLSGAQAAPRPFIEAPFTVGGISNEANLVKVRSDDEEEWLICDPAGHQLWNGAGDDCTLFEPGWAVVELDGAKAADRTFLLVSLNADAAKRSEVKLQLDVSRWEIEVDRFGRRVEAQTGNKWVELDPATGKARRSGTASVATPIPSAVVREQPVGRYRLEFARLVEKSQPSLDDPLTTWCPKDAWRVGSSMLVLDLFDRVLVPAKRHGFAVIGFCEGAERFGLSKSDLVVADDNGHMIAGFAPGPALVQEFAGKGTLPAEPMPPGPWRVDGMDFICPHAGPLQWDPAKAGFTPRLLRNAPGNQPDLLVITDSLILALDAATARQMGTLSKQ